jgi:hypothetical protein
MASRTAVLPVILEDGTVVQIEATALGGEEDVGFHALSFQGVTDAIESIAATVAGMLKNIKPHKGSVEFGIEVAVESGQLTALLVKGAGTANLKITLEWAEP